MLSWAAWCYCSNTCARSSTRLCSREVSLLAQWGSCPHLTDGQQAWRSQTMLPKELFLQTRLPPGLRSLRLTEIVLGSSAKGASKSRLQPGISPTCPRQRPSSASSPGGKCQVHAAPVSPSQLTQAGTRLCQLCAPSGGRGIPRNDSVVSK